MLAVVAVGVRLFAGGSSSASTSKLSVRPSSAVTDTSPTASPSSWTSEPTSSSPPAPAASAFAPVVSPASAAAALKKAVLSGDKGSAGRLSVAVTDLKTGIVAAYDAKGHGFATASIVKADILSTVLLQRHGMLTSGQRSLARRMIEHSDNNAASALWRQIGRAEGLDEANERFGLTSTHGGRGSMWGTTTTTAGDQLRLLRTIFTEDSALSAASRDYIRDLMGDVEPDQDWGVSAADTRKGEQYFVKDGWLPRTATGLWVVNSIGSVKYHGHPLLIAAVSDGRHSMDTGVRILESVSKAAAKAVTGI